MNMMHQVLAAGLAAAAVSTAAVGQTFVGEEAERRVQYEWISNSMQNFGDDQIESFDITGIFDEAIGDADNLGEDYILTVDADQVSEITDDLITASGSSSFYFEAGEFAQGASADITASSTFFYFFQVTEDGPYNLSAALTATDLWNVDITLANDTTGDVLLSQSGEADIEELYELNSSDFYVFEVASFGTFVIDDRNAFEVIFEGFSEYNITFAPAPNLTVSGTCPGTTTVSASQMTPFETVAFVYAFGPGSQVIPNGPCAGVELGLNGTAALAALATADADGIASLTRNVGPGICGNVFLQAIDLTTCTTTDVELVD